MKYLVQNWFIFFLISIVKINQETRAYKQDPFTEFQLEDPVSFVISQFKTHQIIFLGEPHRVHENVVFVQELIPVLYENNINILFLEFANYDDTARIRKLINAKVFDEKLAKDIIHAQFWEWDYIEYVDLFKAAWKINHNKKRYENHFKIIGINSSDWSSERMQKWTEEDWAKCIFAEAVKKNEKALVYCGAHHAITKYQQPYALDGKFGGMTSKDRMGQYLYSMIGDRCMTIWFHFLWPDPNYRYNLLPFQGWLDSLVSTLPPDKQEFAFDSKTSCLGLLKDSTSLYSMGYNPLQLKQVADGYIVLKPICKLTFVENAKHFVTKQNIENTIKQVKYYYNWNDISIQSANDSLIKRFQKDKESFYLKLRNLKCR